MTHSGAMDVLYSFRRCPYAMRARMAVLISGVPVELREVSLRAKPAEMIAASPKATVPVLVLNNGVVVEESLDIMRWALALHDPERWLAGDDRALVGCFDRDFKHHLDRYKYADRYQADPLFHRRAAAVLLATLEARLTQNANLCGDARSFADVAIMPFVRQFAAVDADWFAAQPMPGVQAWLIRHTASPLFGQAMQRRVPWAAGDVPVILQRPC